MLQHGLPDAPRADNAHGAVGDIPADLALQGVVLQLAPLEDVPRLAQAHQHQHNGKVRHAIGGIIHVGHLHAQLPGLFQIHMGVADGATADRLYPKVVKALQHGCAHITGGQRYRIVACGQLGVFHGRIRLGIAVLDAPLLCQILQDALLIVGAQSIEKYFDCHKILLLVLFYRNACLCGASCTARLHLCKYAFIVARLQMEDSFFKVNFVHFVVEAVLSAPCAQKRLSKHEKQGMIGGGSLPVILEYC